MERLSTTTRDELVAAASRRYAKANRPERGADPGRTDIVIRFASQACRTPAARWRISQAASTATEASSL